MTATLTDWFAKQQELLSIETKEVPLADMKEWRIEADAHGNPSYIGHTSGRYHRGVFLRAFDRVRKEWVERFLLAPIPDKAQEALYGVALLARYDGKYLVQAKAEPGNATPGHVQLTSTIQASYVNMRTQLSGAIPFTELYDDPRTAHFIVSQDGAQLYLKRNKVCFLELADNPGELPSNYTWATKEEICALAQEGLVSEHVMQCLGAEALARTV